jgi:hypothetical protein
MKYYVSAYFLLPSVRFSQKSLKILKFHRHGFKKKKLNALTFPKFAIYFVEEMLSFFSNFNSGFEIGIKFSALTKSKYLYACSCTFYTSSSNKRAQSIQFRKTGIALLKMSLKSPCFPFLLKAKIAK